MIRIEFENFDVLDNTSVIIFQNDLFDKFFAYEYTTREITLFTAMIPFMQKINILNAFDVKKIIVEYENYRTNEMYGEHLIELLIEFCTEQSAQQKERKAKC